MSWTDVRVLAGLIGVITNVSACEGGGARKPNVASKRTSATSSAEVQQPSAAPGPMLDDGLHEIDGPGLMASIRASGHKATLINIWASWCGSCKHELPMLVGLSKALESEGVGLVFVSVDKPEARKTAAELLDTLSPRPDSYLVQGSLGLFKRAINPAWKGALPATGLYDAIGKLVWFWPGDVLEHELTNIVTQFLAGKPLEGPVLVEPGAD